MDVTIDAASLKKLVKKLMAVGGPTVLIDPAGWLKTANQDIAAIVRFPESSTGEPVAVASKLFSSTVSKLSREVRIFRNGTGPLLIQSAKFKAELPVIESTVAVPVVEGKTESFTDLYDKLAFAATVCEDKANFDCTSVVRLVSSGKRTTVVATDRKRVAVVDYEDTVDRASLDVMIPSKLLPCLKDMDGAVDLTNSRSMVFFSTSDMVIGCRKPATQFPDWQRVFPKSYNLEVTADAGEMRESLQRVSPTVDVEDGANRLTITFNQESAVIKSGNQLIGTAEDEFPLETLFPDPLFDEPASFKIAVNHKFVSQFLSQVSGKIKISAIAQGQPVLFECGNRKTLIAGLKA